MNANLCSKRKTSRSFMSRLPMPLARLPPPAPVYLSKQLSIGGSRFWARRIIEMSMGTDDGSGRGLLLRRRGGRACASHGCHMVIARFLNRRCLALLASGLWLRYATLQNLIPSFPWIAPPRPPPWRNPRKGRDQILPSGNLGASEGDIYKQ